MVAVDIFVMSHTWKTAAGLGMLQVTPLSQRTYNDIY